MDLDLDVKMHDLIGDVELNDDLALEGERDRDEREQLGWDAVHWRREADLTTIGIRWRIDEALRVLDEMATAADVGFEATHGGQTKRHGKSNVNRAGAGYSADTAAAAKKMHTGAPDDQSSLEGEVELGRGPT